MRVVNGFLAFLAVCASAAFAQPPVAAVTAQAAQPLIITTAAFAPGVVGVPYSFQLAASGGVTPFTWGVVQSVPIFSAPGAIAPGLVLDAGTGLVTGTPTAAGTFGFTITLTDSTKAAVSKIFTITVTASGPLAIVTGSLPNGMAGANYSQTLQASGGIPPYKWSIATGSLPNGLTLDVNAGIISGTPVAAGGSNFTVMVADSASPQNTAKQALSITDAAPALLTIATYSLPGGTQGAPYSQPLAATGGVPPYLWSVTAGALPAGLTLAASSGILSGTPTAAGSSSFTIQATDSAAGTPAKALQPFNITIAQLTPLSVAAGALAAGTVNSPYSQTLPANGGAPPYSWSVIAGSLPPGLLLSGSGTLSGVPTLAAAFGFTAQAVDATGGAALGAFTLTVNSASLSLVPLTPPSGLAGAPYPSQILNATGGTPPYTFSIQGGLPPGLSLTNGLIGGTPTSAGTTSFTVQVTDSTSATATDARQIVVRPSLPADLVLSASALSFTLSAGATDVPEPQNFTVASSSTVTLLSYQVTVSPAAPWLSVTGGLGGTANTPGGIGVSLNSQALALMAATTPYTTTISVTCITPSPCAGSVQKVNVALTIDSPPPQLTLTKTLVALAVSSANGQAAGQFGIQNAGGGSIVVNSVTAADAWVTVSGVPSTVAPGPPAYVTVTASAAGLAPGLYRSTITVASSAGSANIPVTLLVSTSLTMTLNPAGQQFQMPAGGVPGNPNGTVEVLASAGASFSWSAATLPGSTWLTVKTPTGSSTSSSPGTVSYSIDPVASAALAAGTYYGTIRVTSAQVTNTPQDFLVVLNVANVAGGGAAGDPDPEPGGLLFILNGTDSAVPPQRLTLYASSAAALAYQAAAVTASGAAWLTVTPTSGSASASSPAHPTISVNQSGLAAGVFRGVVTYQFSSASLRSVNVTIIVPNFVGGPPQARPARSTPESSATGGTCTPSTVVETASGIPSNFAPQLAWPTPLAILLTDDCGTSIANGTVDVTFSNGDPPLPLSPDPSSPGLYAATWTPHAAANQVTITASAAASGLAPSRVQITGKVTPNLAPAITPGAMLNVFNPVVGGGIAPGTAVAIYGSNFAPPGTSTIANSLPFPTTLSNVSALIGGVAAPLYYVSPGQINAEAPFELMPGVPYQVLVNANGALTTPDAFVSAVGAPGIAAFANGGIIAQHLDGSLITDSSPAMPGEAIVFYLAGLGSTANQPATGNPAPPPPTGPLSAVTLTLNGAAVPTLFVGLTPTTVGLYQIDFTVPAGTSDGSQVLAVSQAGLVSNVTILPVHH